MCQKHSQRFEVLDNLLDVLIDNKEFKVNCRLNFSFMCRSHHVRFGRGFSNKRPLQLVMSCINQSSTRIHALLIKRWQRQLLILNLEFCLFFPFFRGCCRPQSRFSEEKDERWFFRRRIWPNIHSNTKSGAVWDWKRVISHSCRLYWFSFISLFRNRL